MDAIYLLVLLGLGAASAGLVWLCAALAPRSPARIAPAADPGPGSSAQAEASR